MCVLSALLSCARTADSVNKHIHPAAVDTKTRRADEFSSRSCACMRVRMCVIAAADVARCIQHGRPRPQHHSTLPDLLRRPVLGHHDHVRSRRSDMKPGSDLLSQLFRVWASGRWLQYAASSYCVMPSHSRLWDRHQPSTQPAEGCCLAAAEGPRSDMAMCSRRRHWSVHTPSAA